MSRHATTAVALARPDAVLRVAALLGGSADELGTAIAACHRSAEVRWVGKPNEQYQSQLSRLAAGLTGLRAAFDAACDELLAYSRALEWAQPLAEEADRLDLAPVGEALMGRAEALRAQAVDIEAAAAVRLVTALDALTDRAPRVSGLTSAGHAAASFALGLDDALHGIGATVLAAARSLPGVGSRAQRSEARGQVVDAAMASLQPWKQVQELYQAVRDGHGFRASGEVAAALLFRFRGARGKTVELFGSHDELPDRVMHALVRGSRALPPDVVVDAYLLQRLRRDFIRSLIAFEHVPLPSLDDLLTDRVDLLHHEAGGGHTLLKHIGRDPDFLRRRQLLEPKSDGSLKAMSSFSTIDEAETAVSRVVRSNAAAIRDWLDEVDPSLLELKAPVGDALGILIDEEGLLIRPETLVVRLQRDEGGRVLVNTAFLDR